MYTTNTAPNGVMCPTHACAVSWSSVLAGAIVATIASLALFMLGSSLGFATVSPWENEGVSAVAFGAGAAIWLIVMQWVSSALGGYMAGRLRKRWVAVHTDEVCFRDTAHGFLTWAVATLLTAAMVACFASSMVKGGAAAVTTVAAAGAAGAASKDNADLANPIDYYVDGLYRNGGKNASDESVRAETARIYMTGIKNDAISAADRDYLVQVVAARSDLSQAEASARVDQNLAQLKEAKIEAKKVADDARKTASAVMLITFLSMLVGAFIACVSAVLGGRCRDDDSVIVATV